ncbi:KR domain-containing protein [Xylaria venustula]|nr:KR domain-containing protein [Xylaria venustula]
MEKQSLDFFAILSSVSGVIGNKDQTNYASGNTVLDAFTSYRQDLGLAANTVDMGAIQNTSTNEAALRQILSYSILQQDGHRPINAENEAQLITGITCPLKASSSDMVGEPLFRALCGKGDADGIGVGDDSGGKDSADQAARGFLLMTEYSAAGGDKSLMVQGDVS